MGQTNSKTNSELVTVKQTVINDCNKALDELAIYDKLLEAKENESQLLREQNQLLRDKFELAKELAETRKNQADSISEANSALKEAIAAKDKLISNKDAEIEILKKRKTKLTTIFKAVGVGIGIGLLLK